MDPLLSALVLVDGGIGGRCRLNLRLFVLWPVSEYSEQEQHGEFNFTIFSFIMFLFQAVSGEWEAERAECDEARL